jgi:acyl-CoA thioester hydrolase
MSLDRGRRFATTVRVRYAETDAMRFVHHANHLVYFEVARTEALAAWGLPYHELEASGCAIPVLQSHCDHVAPARYGDTLAILADCHLVDGLRLRFDYEIRRDDASGPLVTTGHTVHVCMGATGRPRRPPPELLAILAAGDREAG